MSTEQTQADSESSIIERMANSLEPAAEVPVETKEPVQVEAAEEQTEAVVEDQEDPDTFDFETDDGEVVKVPAKLKPALERHADYTRKTEEVARIREQAEDRMKFAEAREQLVTAAFEDITTVKILQKELERYKNADWESAFNSNPGQAMRWQQEMGNIERQIAEKQQTINSKAKNLSDAMEQHAQTQWNLAEQGAVQRIGKISAEENQMMEKVIRDLGMTTKEFKTKFADPRIIHAVYKAAKWDALQSTKAKAMDSVKGAPPVVKPGASKGPGVAAEQKYKDARQALKKSGDVRDAARLFMLRG